MSHLKTLNNFIPIFKLSLREYKSFSHLWGIKLIFVKFTYSPVRLRSERIAQKRVARLAPGFVRERHNYWNVIVSESLFASDIPCKYFVSDFSSVSFTRNYIVGIVVYVPYACSDRRMLCKYEGMVAMVKEYT